ncbi:MAG: hypothetical protein SPE72_02770 [Alloprevotella sp.]|nr:hypothetical protein [Alloprevotella sp.]
MKRITYLLSLFLMVVGTATAQTYITPGTEKVLTSEALRALTAETPIILCPVQNTQYGKWYDGSTGTYATSGTVVTEANIFVWVPILSDGNATGTGYLKKRTAEADVAFLQTNNTTTFGQQSSAQVFYPVTPVSGSGTGNEAIGIDNIVSNYDAANLVRLVCGNSKGTTWFNYNGKQYNSGIGIWTAMEVRSASDIQAVASHTVGKAIVSADDLRPGYKYLVRNISASRSGYVYVDAAAPSENLKVGSISSNSFGDEYVFTAEAADGGVYLKAANGEYIPSATGGHLNTSATAAVVTIAPKGGSYPKTTLNLMVNGNYCNVDPGQMCVWNDVNDANGVWEIIPVDAADFVSVTVRGRLAANNSQTVDLGDMGSGNYLPNQWVVGNASNYDYISGGEAVQLDGGATEIIVPFTENLPFTASANYENAVWYLIDMHSNDTGEGAILSGAKNYIWTATTNAEAYTSAEVSLPQYDTKQIVPFGDNMLWCFVGNVADGFRIYNKAAGAEYALAKPETGNTAAKLAAVVNATPFRIYKSTGITGATCFKKQGDTDFVNTQKVGDVKVLRGWGAADGGSSCRFFAPDYYLLNYAASLAAGPANSLGTAKYFNVEGTFEDFNNAIAAANADHHSVDAMGKLSSKLLEYANDPANAETNDATIAEGYYRLMNCMYKTYMTNDANNALRGNVSVSDALAKAGTIVKVVAAGDNYKLLVQGLEVGQVTTSKQVGLFAEGGAAFTITPTNNKFVFQNVANDNGYKCLHQAADHKVVGWEAAAEASKWYIVPATTLNVNLNVVGDKTYATTYLPFGVTLPDDVKAYIVAQAAAGVATVSEVDDIPANQGVVLVGQNASVTSVALTLGTASANCSGNLLSGRNTQLTIDEAAKANYFIFGNGDNGVGFYHPNSTTLKENRAFLPAANVSAGSSASGFRLDFGGEITGIASAIQADDTNATYYDLSGRRVNRPAKGLYVKDGKKIYVK